MQDEYHDLIDSLNQAIDAENTYNVSTGLKNTVSEIKDLKKKIITWLKQMMCLGFNSRNYDLNVLEKHLNSNLLKSNANLSPIKRGNSFNYTGTCVFGFKKIFSTKLFIGIFLKTLRCERT